MKIQYLSNKEIDKVLWDQCIAKSKNNLVYGYSWYLDALADQWDGMVIGNYDAVFPLPFRKKLGLYYLYQPYFTQQLGLFSKKKETVTLDKVLDSIPSKFKFWDIQLNGLFQSNKYKLSKRVTFHIHLKNSYENIKLQYKKDAIKNIRKANADNWELLETTDYHSIIEDYKLMYGGLNQNIRESDYARLFNALEKCIDKDAVYIYILNNDKKQRMASAIFLRSRDAIHYIIGAPTVDGRESNATHVLIDRIIEKHASSNLVFDFEGSEIPSVASFYKKFGVEEHTYFRLKVNKLPFPLNLLKK